MSFRTQKQYQQRSRVSEGPRWSYRRDQNDRRQARTEQSFKTRGQGPPCQVPTRGLAQSKTWRFETMSCCCTDFFERTHLLYRKKWIDKETWSQWSAFLKAVAKHPMFREIHRTGKECTTSHSWTMFPTFWTPRA